MVLRQASTDKSLGSAVAILRADFVDGLRVRVDPSGIEVVERSEGRLDSLEHLFLRVELGLRRGGLEALKVDPLARLTSRRRKYKFDTTLGIFAVLGRRTQQHGI